MLVQNGQDGIYWTKLDNSKGNKVKCKDIKPGLVRKLTQCIWYGANEW